MTHSWIKVEEDIRRSVLEKPRPIVHRCCMCDTYRVTVKYGTRWYSFYGEPYVKIVRKAPECTPS